MSPALDPRAAGMQRAASRAAVAVLRGFVLIAVGAALLAYSAWTHNTLAIAGASIAVLLGASGLYWAGVARGALR